MKKRTLVLFLIAGLLVIALGIGGFFVWQKLKSSADIVPVTYTGTYYWTGNGVTGNWSDSNNWADSTGKMPALISKLSGSRVILGGSGRKSKDSVIDRDLKIKTIELGYRDGENGVAYNDGIYDGTVTVASTVKTLNLQDFNVRSGGFVAPATMNVQGFFNFDSPILHPDEPKKNASFSANGGRVNINVNAGTMMQGSANENWRFYNLVVTLYSSDANTKQFQLPPHVNVDNNFYIYNNTKNNFEIYATNIDTTDFLVMATAGLTQTGKTRIFGPSFGAATFKTKKGISLADDGSSIANVTIYGLTGTPLVPNARINQVGGTLIEDSYINIYGGSKLKAASYIRVKNVTFNQDADSTFTLGSQTINYENNPGVVYNLRGGTFDAHAAQVGVASAINMDKLSIEAPSELASITFRAPTYLNLKNLSCTENSDHSFPCTAFKNERGEVRLSNSVSGTIKFYDLMIQNTPIPPDKGGLFTFDTCSTVTVERNFTTVATVTPITQAGDYLKLLGNSNVSCGSQWKIKLKPEATTNIQGVDVGSSINDSPIPIIATQSKDGGGNKYWFFQ